jgi:hypothetical protein
MTMLISVSVALWVILMVVARLKGSRNMCEDGCIGPVEAVRQRVRVFKAVMDAEVPVTAAVFEDLWHAFYGVELVVPLPVMKLSEQERFSISSTILGEMNDLLVELGDQTVGWPHEEQAEALENSPTAEKLEGLWRQIAGAHADMINERCDTIPEDEYVDERDSLVEYLMESEEMGLDEFRERLSKDKEMRMFVRRCGLDPDRILQEI